MNLSDRDWKVNYSSNEDNPIADFYIPALERSVQYDRKSGFFNSAILSRVAAGLGAMLNNDGRIRLILGCQFTPDDLQAIQQGYALRDTLVTRLDANFTPPQTFAQFKHFEILSWLIQTGYLDIKIAIPLRDDGIPQTPNTQRDTRHLFHEKTGIFTDIAGNQLAFSGSNNESLGGWQQNVESFHVFCSWQGERENERVAEEAFRFEQLWNNLTKNVRIFDIPDAIRNQLLRYAPTSKPTWTPRDECDTWSPVPAIPETDDSASPPPAASANEPAEPSPTEMQPPLESEETFATLANLPTHPGCLDFCLQSVPISPWPHQLKILRRVAENFPCSFLIADEVGLGKTIEMGLILRYLLICRQIQRVLILVPASVQGQWQEELREKFNLHFWRYHQGRFQSAEVQGEIPQQWYSRQPKTNEDNSWNQHDLILASSHLVRREDRQRALLEAQDWDLVVLDEAHHARRKNPQSRKDIPNSLLKLMRQLQKKTKSLALLSATPMQIDPVEVFDLLFLLGIQGNWQYADNFCEYFATLTQKPNRHILEFWQQMSFDYFQRGGQPCSRLNQYLKNRDRLLFYKLEDTWRKGKPRTDFRRLADDGQFIQASRQYLTTNTPIKDLMFRHTRDTLRQYYQRGLLERDIPQREVSDNAIALEREREVPLYRAVSDYVRNFYKLAQKENRKALGFLMTLYRKRLTSSFAAIRQSLQRRLDGISISDLEDDLADLEEADDAVIAGLETYMNSVDSREIEYLEDLLQQFENTGEDSKLSYLVQILRRELGERENAIIFTQYTDTMDYLRDELRNLYGSKIACYSGRGGELYDNQRWHIVSKEEIKRMFRDGKLEILLCTESASEGLNLQTCGVLVNYDMPWNPMRVEQRIGRLDRIGQRYSTVRIHNFYYDGTIEAKVYQRLRQRIDLFANVVGPIQPIVAQVPTFIEQVTMSADPQEEDVLMAEFERGCKSEPLRPSIDEMATMDVESDLNEIRRDLPAAPITCQTIEQLFTTSPTLKQRGVHFHFLGNGIWEMHYQNRSYQVTFQPSVAEKNCSLRVLHCGDPLFEFLQKLAMA
jgi:ERCC4-related helicase